MSIARRVHRQHPVPLWRHDGMIVRSKPFSEPDPNEVAGLQADEKSDDDNQDDTERCLDQFTRPVPGMIGHPSRGRCG